MLSKLLVSIGLVTWNSADRLGLTLDALTRQTYSPLEIIVVDNGSADTSLERVTSCLPNARIIENRDNRGFCGGHNQAIRASRGDYYLALNPDAVMRPDYVEQLVEALEAHPRCGSAAAKLLQSAGNGEPPIIDSTGLFLDRRRRQYLRGHGEQDRGQYDEPGEVFGVDGAAPLYRRAMLDRIKVGDQFFDEAFFAHKEDVDLAWRAQIAGWSCWYTPTAVAYHPRSFKPGQRDAISPTVKLHAVKNRYLLLLRNESRAGWRRDGAAILWYDLQILVYMCLFERTSLEAFGLVRKLWPHIMDWRRQIWAAANSSSEKLLTWFR